MPIFSLAVYQHQVFLLSLLMNSQILDKIQNIILFDIYQMMQQAELHKNTSIAIIIYFIQNLQLYNSVVGAVMVMVVDHLNHATTGLPCWSIIK